MGEMLCIKFIIHTLRWGQLVLRVPARIFYHMPTMWQAYDEMSELLEGQLWLSQLPRKSMLPHLNRSRIDVVVSCNSHFEVAGKR